MSDDLNRTLDDLSDEQRRLLSRLLNEEGIELAGAIASQETGRAEAPLSFTQERLWVGGELAPGTAFGNVPFAFRVSGPLDSEILLKSVEDIVRRHHVLRTRYPVVAGERIQRVSESVEVSFRTADLSEAPEAERLERALSIANEEAHRPFDLREDPPLRVLVVRLGETDHVLLLVTHHFATDGWGIRVLLRELVCCYEALRGGGVVPQDVPFQYTDFAVWQRERVRVGELDEQLAYWEERLRGCPKQLRFPGVDPSAARSPKSAVLPVRLDEDLSTRLRDLSRAEGVTLYMTLMAAFQTALHLYTREPDVVAGTIISNRTRRDTEQLVGNFGNNVFCRLEFARLRSFRDVLRATREGILTAQRHQDAPLEVLIDQALACGRENPVPRFQVLFLLRDSALVENLAIEGLSFEQLPIVVDLMPLDVFLDLTDSERGITGFLACNEELLGEPVARQLHDALLVVLRTVVRDPGHLVEDMGVDVPSPPPSAGNGLAEARRSATTWRRPSEEDWYWQPVWRDIELDRSAPATSPGDWLVFLDDCGLGHELVSKLESHNGRVLTVRSGDSFCRTGEASYELNPEMGRSGYEALFADLSSRGFFPTHITHLWLVTGRESFSPGSTFFHRNLEHGYYSLCHLAEALRSTKSDTPVQVTVVSTGIHQVSGEALDHPEKAAALGPIRVIPRELPTVSCRHIDLAPLHVAGRRQGRRTIRRRESGVVDLLESFAVLGAPNATVAYRDGTLMRPGYERWTPSEPERSEAGASSGQTYLIAGGLGCVGHIAARALARSAPVNLVLVSREPWPADPDAWTAEHAPDDSISASIIHVRELESLGATVSVVAADMADPSAIAEAVSTARRRFGGIDGVIHAASSSPTPLPFDRAPADGAFAPGIYGALALASALADDEPRLWVTLLSVDEATDRVDASAAAAFASALATGGIPGPPRKVVVAWGPWSDMHEAGMSATEAEAVLARVLGAPTPGHLRIGPIPPSDDGVEEPRGRARAARPRGAHVKARDEIERTLVKLWGTALGVTDIDIRDNFFELGGHSLMAVRLLAQVSEAFSLDWPLSTLLTAPTIEEFADLIRVQQSAVRVGSAQCAVSEHEFLVPMAPGPLGEDVPFFVAAGGFGNVLNLRHLAQIVGADRPVYGLQARGLLGHRSPHDSFESMAIDYLREVREIQPHGPYLIGGFCTGGIAAFEMAHRLSDEGEQVALLVLFDAPCPNQEDTIGLMDKVTIQRHGFRERGWRYPFDWARKRVRWELERRRARRGDDTGIRSQEIFAAAKAAMRHYQPKAYAGAAVLFRPVLEKTYVLGPGRVLNSTHEFVREDNGWGPYLENLNVHEVPGDAGDHDEFILEPKVRNIALPLRSRLVDALRRTE